jgi:hypothetical protein
MPQFSVSASADVSDVEALALYESVGWAAYTRDPGQLVRAIRNSSQTVLLTDNEPGQRAFYEALGFTEGADFSPEPLRVFALFR